MKSLDDINVIVQKMENKFELSHQATAKTISDFGGVINDTKSEVNNTRNDIVELKTIVKDFITRTDKVIDGHEKSIDTLAKSDTEIRTAFKTGRYVAGLAMFVILSLGATITGLWANAYHSDQKELRGLIQAHEEKDSSAVDRLIELLSKKDGLGSEQLDIIANIYAE